MIRRVPVVMVFMDMVVPSSAKNAPCAAADPLAAVPRVQAAP
jgi:hypothetical protein